MPNPSYSAIVSRMQNSVVISAILAMSENRVIGLDNQLPWHLPADLKHFKTLTTGHPIIMGRKTYQAIGKALPNRTNIILTRDATFTAPDCIVTTSAEEALESAKEIETVEIFIIGGAEIYKIFFPYIQRIYLTQIHQQFEGDTYFQALNPNEWREVARADHVADEKNPYAYSFVALERRRT